MRFQGGNGEMRGPPRTKFQAHRHNDGEEEEESAWGRGERERK